MSGNESAISAAKLLAEAFDALSVAAAIVDNADKVIAISAECQRLVEAQTFLRMQDNSLECVQDSDTEKLRAAIKSSRVVGLALPSELRTLTFSSHAETAKVTVAPLLLDHADMSIDSPTLIVIERIPRQESAQHIALREKKLTHAEIEVAAMLLQGRRMAEIAERRHVSIETVRSQVKTIYSKLGVANQVELLATMRRH
nr:helix-turn-helix transcriptional regulator [Solimonas soli]